MSKIFLPALCVLSLSTAWKVSAQTYVVQLPDSIATAGTPVVWVKRVAQYCEGPAWEAATGAVYFTEQRGNGVANWPIWKVFPGGDTAGAIFYNTYQNNGLEFDPQGRLVAAQNGRLSRLAANGTVESTLVISPANGVTFGMANDLSIGSNGAMYFTTLGNAVYYLSPTRTLTTATNTTGTVASANGIEWLEEDNAVFVNETSGNRVRRLPITSAGVLGAATTFTASPGPDGGTVDAHGNRYVASYSQGEIRVFNARGDSLGFIRLRFPQSGTAYDNRAGSQGNADNCVFGGPGLTTLYMTGDGGLYSIQLKIAGRTRPGTTAIRGLSARKVAGAKQVGKKAAIDALGRDFWTPAYRAPVKKLFPVK